MRKIALLLLLVIFSSAFFAVIHKKKNFVDQVTIAFNPLEKWESDLTDPFLDQILNQKFTYLSRGTQSIVFSSDDGKYVLKFFKMNHLCPRKWIKYLPYPLFPNLKEKKVFQKEQRMHRLFDALHYSYREFKDETGLLFIHINPSNSWNRSVTLIGKDGKTFVHPLGNTSFIIQKKAKPLFSELFQLIEAGKVDEAKRSLRSFFSLIQSRGNKGLFDDDHSVSNNFGFVDGNAIQFDIGELFLVNDPDLHGKATAEVQRIGLRIQPKIEAAHPEFVPIYQEILREFES